MRTGSELTQIDWNINCPFSSPKTDESAQNSESPRWGEARYASLLQMTKFFLRSRTNTVVRTWKVYFMSYHHHPRCFSCVSRRRFFFYQLEHCTKRLLIVYFAPKDVWEISSSYKLKRISSVAATSGAHYIMEHVIWWISSSHDKLNRKRVSYSHCI